jgi:hypothetical protein
MRHSTSIRMLVQLAIAVLLAGCGGGGGGDTTPEPPTIMAGSPPAGASGVDYPGYTFTVESGGTAPFTWSETGPLPPGQSFNNAGTLSGLPTTAGTYPVTITVTDSSIPALSGALPVSIVIADSPIVISTAPSPPSGMLTHPYPSFAFAVTGGSPPFTWSLKTGTLPEGLTLGPDGSLSGTVSPTAVSSTFTLAAADSAQSPQSVAQSFTVAITDPGPPVIDPTAVPPAGTTGVMYGYHFTATGGFLPLSWKLDAGALPPGLTLGTDGSLNGTPTSPGTFPITVSVTDSGSTPAVSSASFSVTINSPVPPTIDYRSLPTGTVGLAYTPVPLTAVNGVAPFVWSATGTLAGLELSLDGVLAGTPVTAGHFPISVNVRDALSQTAPPMPFTVRVSLARPPGVAVMTGSMTVARSWHTATLLLDRQHVLVTGGGSETAELYDSKSGTFIATGSMSVARSGHTATLLTNASLPNYGKVLIVGGESTGSSAELYDPATGIFTVTGSATGMLAGHTATLLASGKVLLVAGQGTVSAELYDPATGTFAATGDLNVVRIGHTATLLLDGRVLIAGGATNSAELYDPASGTFTETGLLSRLQRGGATATRLTDGTVLVAGPDDTAEIFDPTAGIFTLAGDLAGSLGATASLRKDGTVLVAGGWSPVRFYGSCSERGHYVCGGPHWAPTMPRSFALTQSFAPESQGYTAAGSLNVARHGHTATVLADGTLLITGGAHSWLSPSNHPTTASYYVLSSAELFK